MSVSECVHASPLDRLAVVYVRQSRLHQALANQESLKLQYDLACRARSYGWEQGRIRTIDADVGRSGRTVEGRPGFQGVSANTSRTVLCQYIPNSRRLQCPQNRVLPRESYE